MVSHRTSFVALRGIGDRFAPLEPHVRGPRTAEGRRRSSRSARSSSIERTETRHDRNGSATPRNGVDVPTLFTTLDAVKKAPEIAHFPFRAQNEWVSGTHSRSTVQGFLGARPRRSSSCTPSRPASPRAWRTMTSGGRPVRHGPGTARPGGQARRRKPVRRHRDGAHRQERRRSRRPDGRARAPWAQRRCDCRSHPRRGAGRDVRHRRAGGCTT